MSDQPKIFHFASFDRLVIRLREDFYSGGNDYVLLYAYKGIGKTPLSMEFKPAGKVKNSSAPNTLHFNANTEDLFVSENDLQGERKHYNCTAHSHDF